MPRFPSARCASRSPPQNVCSAVYLKQSSTAACCFLTDNTAPHALFCSLALDLLKSDPAAVVHLADPAHCGNACKDVFAAFTPSGRAENWCSTQEFTRGIEALCRAAAEKYAELDALRLHRKHGAEYPGADAGRSHPAHARQHLRACARFRAQGDLPAARFSTEISRARAKRRVLHRKNDGIYISEDVFTVPRDLPRPPRSSAFCRHRAG